MKTDRQLTANPNLPLSRAENEAEHIRLLRQLRFFRQTDDLHLGLYYNIEPMLRNIFTEDSNIFTTTDVKEMMKTLLDIDKILALVSSTEYHSPFECYEMLPLSTMLATYL